MMVNPLVVAAAAACFLGLVGQLVSASSDDHYPKARRYDGAEMPLIGFGVGNLPSDRINQVVNYALAGESPMGYRLLDTGASNEVPLAEAIDNALKGVTEDDTVHVITKVWYTYLGHERTTLAVKESFANLKAFPSGQYVRVHVLLHWPRCNDEISWMDCEGEEERLPQHVKDAGPPPHKDPDAWKGSWKALEELYADDELRQIESIGVSNFGHEDFKTLIDEFEIVPHIIQGNVWSLMFDPWLMNMVKENKVIFQAYNVMNGVVQRRDAAPNAYRVLKHIGDDLGRSTVAQTVLAWLVQQNVSVIPRASSLAHQDENSPYSLSMVPTITDEENAEIEKAVKALLKGEDIEPPEVIETIITNSHENPVTLFYISEEGEEVPALEEPIKPGDTVRLNTHPGHVFVAYDEDRSFEMELEVEAEYGERQYFDIGEPESVVTTFINSLKDAVSVFWINEEGEEIPAHEEALEAGDTLELNAHPGHLFVAYNQDKSVRKELMVDVEYGEQQFFDIGEL